MQLKSLVVEEVVEAVDNAVRGSTVTSASEDFRLKIAVNEQQLFALSFK